MDENEILISDYFAHIHEESHSRYEWREASKIRNSINSFKLERDAYEWIRKRRMSAWNRAEDKRLFGIPEDAVCHPWLHPNKKNEYYGIYFGGRSEMEDLPTESDEGEEPSDGGSEPAPGTREYDESDEGFKANKLKLLRKIKRLAIIAAVIIGGFALVMLFVYVAGVINSLGHTPFVLCGEGNGIIGKTADAYPEAELEQMATSEYAAQAFIITADAAGWKSNAVIGALAYILAEGGGKGTFTYEAYYLSDSFGPSGANFDYTLNNEAWLDWMEYDYREYMHTHYYHADGNHYKQVYACVGLGLLGESEVWWTRWETVYVYDEETGEVIDSYQVEVPYKVYSQASNMINWIEENCDGAPWQDPKAHIEWVMHRFSVPSAFDGDNANPCTDNRSAEEWCARVVCGIGMPAWDYDTSDPYQREIINGHVNMIPRATELYQKYSGKSISLYSLSGASRDLCDGMNLVVIGSNEDIAHAAVALAGAAVLNTSEYDFLQFDMHGPDSPHLQAPELRTYKICHETIWPNDIYFASCDRGSATAIVWAGADDTFPRGACPQQLDYLGRSSKWTYVGIYGQCDVQPGDVGITKGHIFLYIGHDIIAEKFPDSDPAITCYQASLNGHFPCCVPGTWFLGQNYQVYRCTNPDNSDKFTSAHEGIVN